MAGPRTKQDRISRSDAKTSWMTRALHRLAVLVAASAWLVAPCAWAQQSGGRLGGSSGFHSGGSSSGAGGHSYGGSSFGSSGRSSSSQWSGHSWTRPSHSDSDSYSSGPLRPTDGHDPISEMLKTIFLVGVPGGVIALTLIWARRWRPWERSNDESPARTDVPRCEIRRVSVAFDWTARATLQAALDAAASRYDATTPQGRVDATVALRDLLATHIASARYACFQTFPADRESADDRFARAAADLNCRYTQRTIENARRAQLDGEIFARAEEGEGLVVVSIVVGTAVPLGPLMPWPTRDTVRHALATLVPGRADDLVALEIVWSPSVDSDRLSSAELQVLYPELVPLDGSGGGVGRVVCSHCRCVYALELKACPACASDESVPAPDASARGGDGHVTSGTTMKCRYCGKPMPVYEVQCHGCGGRAAS